MREVNYNGSIVYVPEDGRIFGPTKRERKIQQNKNRQSRRYINTKAGTVFVHILVAKAYPEICGEWFDGCDVHHKDGDVSNNNAANLQIVSQKEHRLLHKGILVQEDKEGNIVGEYISSLEAERKTGISGAAIRDCLCGKSKTSGGYIWYRKKAS